MVLLEPREAPSEQFPDGQGKKCVHKDWLTRTYAPDDFGPSNNIGIKSVKGLIDVDCDCTEAVVMAEGFLPKTRAVYGRTSRPKSHWLFRCPEITHPVAYRDTIAKKTLVEVRVSHQSMAPPSVHPQGETVEWDTGFTETSVELVVEKALLLRSVQLVATGAMIARYYNAPGDRHDWGMALSGFLRRLTLTQHETERLFTLAAKVVGDDKVKDRLDAVRTTYTQSEDSAQTGAKRLGELMTEGAGFVLALRKIWGGDTPGVSTTKLDELNKRHAVLFNQAGNVIILTEEEEDGKRQIRYSTRHDFSLLYPHQVQVGITPAGKPIVKSLAEAWVTHPKRRFYRGIELAPNGRSNEGYYNLWQGFSVEPKPGDWSLFRQHIGLLADGNEDYVRYILAWMSETVKHPERPIGIALAFKGGQGVGKSTFARWFGELFGAHFLHLDSEHRLLGQFNAHLHNTILVLADEAVWAGGKQGLGALKRMITEQTLAIERKGIDVINVKNMLHMIVASNEDWFVPTGFDNRRFAIFKVSDARQNQHKFFGAVQDQLMKQGGLGALLYDLLNMPDDVNLRDIPNTDELQEQKKHSMSPRQAWWYEQLQSGTLWETAEQVYEGCWQIDPEPLYAAYVTAMRMGDVRSNPGFMGAVGRFMRTVLPSPFPEQAQHGGKRYWLLPSLAESRKHFDQIMRSTDAWPTDNDLKPGVEVPF